MLNNLIKKLKTNRLFILVIFLIVVFSCIYSYQSIKLYKAHRTRGDLTNFAQAMWNTTQGRIMQNTFNYSVHNFWGNRQMVIPDNSNIFGIHFNPILFLFIPLYFLYPHPETLLIIQAVLTAAGGFFIFVIAKRKIKYDYIAFILTIAYFLYFAVLASVFNEFHASTLAIFFGLLMIYSKEYLKIKYYIFSLILFLFIQENTAIVTIFYGLYLICSKKDRKIGILTSSLSILYFIFTVKFAIPHLSNYKSFIFESVYGNPLGGSINDIVINSIRNPILFLKTIFNNANLIYFGRFIVSSFPFSIFSPLMFLVGITALTPNIISSSTALKSSILHYDSIAVPFIFYSMILGAHNLANFIKKKYILLIFVVSSLILLIGTYTLYKKTISPEFNIHLLAQNIYTQSDADIDKIIKLIPPNASVATQDYISGQLSNRRRLYLFPVYANKVDYLLLSTGQSVWPLERKEQQKLINQLVNDKKHAVIFKDKNFILIKRIN